MPRRCCVYGCRSRFGDLKSRGITFHSFPLDAVLRQEWAQKIRCNLDNRKHVWEPSKTSVLCSRHFVEEDLLHQFGRKTVKHGALPTVFSFTSPCKKRKTVKHMDMSANLYSSRVKLIQMFHNYSVTSPRTLRRSNEGLKQKLALKMRLLKNARKREGRLKKKVSSLLEELKQKRLLTDQAAELLDGYKDLPLHLFRRRASGSAFTVEQQQFAATLHYYSAAAYAYVRSKMPSLPNPRTIRRWLAAFDGQPGLTEESFNRILAANQGQDNGTNSHRICSLMIDEMEIKKHIDTDRYGKVHGFQDIGCGPMDSEDQPQATKALVVLAVGINAHWKLPLAYVLTNGAGANLQVTLLTDVLTKLWECGCIAVSVTFDGLLANQKTLVQLGGSLDPDNIVARFQHPCEPGINVVVIFDACHMMKLARNLLHEYQILTVDGVAVAKWKHLAMLNDIQGQEGLSLGNKITDRHIFYKRQKMKVKLAVQLISSSCTTGLEYLRTNNYPGFEDSLGTEIFLSYLDQLFDILNSRSAFGRGYKAPICCSNAAAKVSSLANTRQFLLRLSDSNGKKITETKRRTCVIGFLATIDSVLYLIQTLVTSPTGINGVRLKYLLTQKLSQDHIEVFFSTIRRRGGWNNNPSALQFISAYRAILRRVGALPSDNGNVTVNAVMEDDVIPSEGHEWLPVDDATASTVCSSTESGVDVDFPHSSSCAFTVFVEDVCTYISGFVVRRLLPKVRCFNCRALLTGSGGTPDFTFLILKDNGGLIKPSPGVISIVRRVEMKLRILVCEEAPAHSISKLGLKLESSILADIEPTKIFGNSSHVLETADAIDNHVFLLVRMVVKVYLDLRKHHILRRWNIQQQGRVVRQTLTKTILFRNQ